MNSQKFISGSIAGGIAYFLLGYLFFGVLLKDFFANNGGVAADMDSMIWWALIVGNVFSGALLTYILMKANVSTPTGGSSTGFVVGLLMGVASGLIMYGVEHRFSLKVVGVDIGVHAVISAISGAVVGWVLGMGKKVATA